MDPTRWQRIEAIFHDLTDLPAGAARDQALAARCGDDTSLAQEVRTLLDEDAGLVAAVDTADPHLGLRLGHYEVTALIARGGMAAVYQARRADDQFQQRVAIKIMDLRLSDPALVAQFRAERQILAALEHPSLTRLLDGGVTAFGEPYLVMEYIEGQPIDRYCDERRLDVRERLRLFAEVCDGVAFAHRNLVLHRDLKPSNILVTTEGRAKVVDFGTATLLQPDRLATTSRPPFTPAYASPEQLVGHAVGTASDQFSLGLVLFELLTGAPAFGERTSLMAGVERALAGTTTAAPQAVVTEDAARSRQTSLAALRRTLSGDLTTIVGKALAHEPEQRYPSIGQLSTDLQLWADGLPILARPDTVGYRLRKLMGRRKLETSAVVFALVALVGGLFAAIVQARRADAQSQRATEVTRFLTAMLSAAEPGALGKDALVRDVLTQASKDAAALEPTPALAAEVRGVIGRAYLALGNYEAAGQQLRLALDAERRAAPDGSVETARLLSGVSEAQELDGQVDEAQRTLDQALAVWQRYPESDPVWQVEVLDQRGRVLSRKGEVEAAIPLFERARALARSRGLKPAVRATAAADLGFGLTNLGRHRESVALYAEAVQMTRAALGPDAALVADRLSPYATALWYAGERQQALQAYEEALRIRRRTHGAEHPDYAWTLANYADSLIWMGQYARAEPMAREVLALRGKTLTDTHPMVPFAMSLLGRALGPQGRLDEAERWLRESLALRSRTLPAGHWLLASSRSTIGAHLVLAGRLAEAEPMLLEAEKTLTSALGDKSPLVADARRRLVDLYVAAKRPADAEVWRSRLPPAS
ncbi:MAG: serine/threonine-protein kinase [Vicinamibacteraceae bacterium]